MESNSKTPSITRNYKDYFKISVKVTEMAKLFEYDKQILKSCNKIKTTRETINTESGRNIKICGQSLNVEGKNIENQEIIADVFNKHFILLWKMLIKTLMLIIL
jgi:hypothetical protein